MVDKPRLKDLSAWHEVRVFTTKGDGLSSHHIWFGMKSRAMRLCLTLDLMRNHLDCITTEQLRLKHIFTVSTRIGIRLQRGAAENPQAH